MGSCGGLSPLVFDHPILVPHCHPVQPLNGGLGVAGVDELDEGVPLVDARSQVADQVDGDQGAVLAERLVQEQLRDAGLQAADVEVGPLLCLKALPLRLVEGLPPRRVGGHGLDWLRHRLRRGGPRRRFGRGFAVGIEPQRSGARCWARGQFRLHWIAMGVRVADCQWDGTAFDHVPVQGLQRHCGRIWIEVLHERCALVLLQDDAGGDGAVGPEVDVTLRLSPRQRQPFDVDRVHLLVRLLHCVISRMLGRIVDKVPLCVLHPEQTPSGDGKPVRRLLCLGGRRHVQQLHKAKPKGHPWLGFHQLALHDLPIRLV
mmetsp:Transcript_154240/g.269823  ORF Transcript_154240/g.269823 Transcript_154240/m.269823 type:complete len:316 (-) Transcript_154240:103-1050(-)